jgi:hypothetical protein
VAVGVDVTLCAICAAAVEQVRWGGILDRHQEPLGSYPGTAWPLGYQPHLVGPLCLCAVAGTPAFLQPIVVRRCHLDAFPPRARKARCYHDQRFVLLALPVLTSSGTGRSGGRSVAPSHVWTPLPSMDPDTAHESAAGGFEATAVNPGLIPKG